MTMMRSVAQSEGIHALYRGTVLGLCLHVPLIGIYLPLYDALHNTIASTAFPTPHTAPAVAPLAAGVIARCSAVLATAPLDFTRTRLQTGCSLPSLITLAMQSPRVLWTGVHAALIKDLPYAAVYWTCLEPCRGALLGHSGTLTSSPMQLAGANAAAAALSASVAAVVTQPADVVKTAAQHSVARGSVVPGGFWAAAASIYERRGLQGLFAGVGVRTLRCGATYAVVMSAYEVLKLKMDNDDV